MSKVPWVCAGHPCMAQYGGSSVRSQAEGKHQEIQPREFNIETPFQRPKSIARSNG